MYSGMLQPQQRPATALHSGRQLRRRPWLRPFQAPQQQQPACQKQRHQRRRLQRAGTLTCASAAASPGFEVAA
jgi:hypothetical protein